jgi:hypothetical protein
MRSSGRACDARDGALFLYGAVTSVGGWAGCAGASKYSDWDEDLIARNQREVDASVSRNMVSTMVSTETEVFSVTGTGCAGTQIHT